MAAVLTRFFAYVSNIVLTSDTQAGIIEWWMRELKKPEVANNRPANLKERPNCKFGRKWVQP